MSENHQRPTVASDIALPVEIVELQRLKTKSGEPVRVLCERVDSLEVVRILRQLPGGRETLDPTGVTVEELTQKFRPFGSELIEVGTALLDQEGSEQRPAFWHTNERPGAFPVRLLDSVDFTLLAMTLLQLSGYVGGAADKAGFSADKRRGKADGTGTVEVLGSDEGDAAGSTERSESSVQPDGHAVS